MTLLRPYCSVQQLRDFIENASANDDLLIAAINSAGRFMESQTGRNFWFNDYTSVPYPVRRSDVYEDVIVLPFEIITLDEVTQDGDTLVQGTEGDYTVEIGTRSIQSNGVFGSIPYKGNITIKGTFGFPLAELDAESQPPPTLHGEINDAAIRIAAAFSGLWRKTTRGFDGITDTVVVQAPPAEVKALLNKYNVNRLRSAF